MQSLIIFLILFVFTAASEAKQTICLNMIVKDESRVIKRCLDSVKKMIDYWVIVDTGSTDGTQAIIKEYLKDIPGELYERPWRNFGESRTEAFELAKGKGDYLLLMDADDVLEYEDGFALKDLTKDLYNMWRGTKDYTYLRPQLIKGNLPWRWIGVTHEYLDCAKPYTSDILEEVKYITCDGGARSHGKKKFVQNIKLLRDGLKKDPNNVRYVFYLAESYRDAGENGKALEYFQKRIDMGGWNEEVFWSMLQIGDMLRRIGLPSNLVIESYKNAHRYRPHRTEPIYYMAEMLNQQENYSEAYKWIKSWEAIPKPAKKDSLFNLDWIEKYGILFQLSICSYYIGQYQESLDACDKLLAMPEMPESWREQAAGNRIFPLTKLMAME